MGLIYILDVIEEEAGVTFKGTRIVVAESDGVAQYKGDPVSEVIEPPIKDTL